MFGAIVSFHFLLAVRYSGPRDLVLSLIDLFNAQRLEFQINLVSNIAKQVESLLPGLPNRRFRKIEGSRIRMLNKRHFISRCLVVHITAECLREFQLNIILLSVSKRLNS